MIKRILNLPLSRSFFLFGARGTGKSSLLRSVLPERECLYIDLLRPEEFDVFNRFPETLSQRIAQHKGKPRWIVLDEIQRVPKLLDGVHYHIEADRLRFALTGSSARKLKHGSANLLAGRAVVYNLFPFTHIELAEQFSLEHALNWGTLPEVFNETDLLLKRKILQAYTHTYLKEEVRAEQLIRALDPFHQFLAVAAQMNGKLINFAAIARECGASDYSVREYYKILEDTLLGFHLPPFHESVRKRQRHSPKFFLFDQGVKRSLESLLTVQVVPRTSSYGEAFEQWLIAEIHRLIHYKELDYSLSYLRTKDDAEIDLIIERPGLPRALVEIKSATTIRQEDLTALNRFASHMKNVQAYCLSLDPHPKKIGAVEVLHWKDGIREIGIW